jgi:hypothetical protein
MVTKSANLQALSIEKILAVLEDVKPIGSGKWLALCPAHEDHNQSLSVTTIGDNGKVLMYCHAGCAYEDILKALGVEVNYQQRQKPVIKATYDYRDESGRLLFQTVRLEPKDFRQRRPDGCGRWLWDIKGTRRVLYHLPELLRAKRNSPVEISEPQKWVYLCEGEKDADKLITDLGLVATTNPMGAGKWRNEYNEFLRGRCVAIIPDNDDPGRVHAQQVAETLTGIAMDVRIVELLGLPKGGDISDWLDKGGSKNRLFELVGRTNTFIKTSVQKDTDFNLTDAGNAERFIYQHGSKMRYCWSRSKWLFYDGKRWNISIGDIKANRLALVSTRNILNEARKLK